MKFKEITLNGRTFEVRESLGDPNCFILTYGDFVVLDDSACEDFYGDIDEVADRMAAYVEEENAKQFPWYTLPTTWVVTDGDCETIDDKENAMRYVEFFNNGTAQEITDREEFLAAAKKLGLDGDCWDVSRIFSFAYEYGQRGYFCRENDDVSYNYDAKKIQKHIQPYTSRLSDKNMKKFILQLGKENVVCNNVEEAKKFISRFGHLTSAGEKRIIGLFDGTIGISRDFAWMMPKHIPELKNYPEQHCRMWVKPCK